MSTFPQGYRAFIPRKLVRTGFLAEASRRGYIWAEKPTGEALVSAVFGKLAEGLHEAQEAGSSTELQEALTDLCETVLFGYRAQGSIITDELEPPRDINPLYTPLKVISMIAQLHNSALRMPLQEGAAMLDYALKVVAQVVFNAVAATHASPVALTPPMLKLATRNKRRLKGPLEGWFLNAVALPSTDELCATFAARHLECLARDLNLETALTPEALTLRSA